ncbi:CvpA family protein [Anaerosacchariphilus polymeriproducens]|uniref:CvpA family protein n=1 Tax=Anaerosacchariphilus polymeriproducens TaxID=1812858 RepID=A0A371AWP4_9FIRM|nr:CvpA family protein [Anaerosacchariphilus polymeriproducens]RDU23973.1 CvpA family protein [Anaerosacchariphilus polymeriproducens]
MKKIRNYIISFILLFIIAFIYYYITLPAINIHSVGFWFFLVLAIAVLLVIYAVKRIKKPSALKESKVIRLGIIIIGGIIVVFVIGYVLSSPIINAKKYQNMLKVTTREFTKDIKEISYNQIPILDKDSSILLGDRKMGSMVDMVSQFEADTNHYTQINQNNTPVRVSPLTYASFIKWFSNRNEGIPAYIKIDMATQDTECVTLKEGIKYSDSEYFGRNIYRHLRFQYPTYIFSDINFEVDDEGTPYWICPVKKFTIGLFGGETVGRVVICNAITGETTDLDVKDVPSWVDRVYSSELLISYYDYYGTLKHGFFNSIFGQKDCMKTTNGYNYIALEDDVWLYTGVTSVNSDQANVGFVLINQRTMETRYYSISGAIEDSAMSSAEGQVQHLRYSATFPLLLNIANEPTYFIALKDASGLVKKYAMVDVQKYQLVAIGDTVAACEKEYVKLLNTNGVSNAKSSSTLTKKGIISKISQGVIEGNTHYYIMLKGSNEIFDIPLLDFINVVSFSEGDQITFEYNKGNSTNTVLSVH